MPGGVETSIGLKKERERDPKALWTVDHAIGGRLLRIRCLPKQQKLDNQPVRQPGFADPLAEVPQGSRPDRSVGVRIGIGAIVEVLHRLSGDQASAMSKYPVVTPVPAPDVGGTEHGRGEVVADPFIERS